MKTVFLLSLLIGLWLAVPVARAQSADAATLGQEFSFDAVSRDAAPDNAAADSSVAVTNGDSDYFRFRMIQQHNAAIYAGILAFTAVLAHLLTLWFLKGMHGAASYVVSVTALIYVVFGTILLVVIANTEAQLTAAMGILGAVAGYVFGKTRREGLSEDARKAALPKNVPASP